LLQPIRINFIKDGSGLGHGFIDHGLPQPGTPSATAVITNG